MVVDDDDAVRKTLKVMLEDAGHRVLIARDGHIAVEISKLQPVEIVFCDIIMPEKEGIQTISEIHGMHPGTKIIAMSGGGRTHNFDYLNVAEKFGATAVLRKPFTKQAMLEAIESCLGRPQK